MFLKVRYLRVILEHSLNLTKHCEVFRDKTLKSLIVITLLLRKPLSQEAEVRVTLYETYIGSAINYSVGFHLKTTNAERALRLIGGYDFNKRIDKIHSYNKILKLKEAHQIFALKL